MTMDALITGNITPIISAVGSWMGTMATTVTSNPLIMVMVGLSVAGFAIGALRRLMNV